jgi:hypothetical protein
MSPRDQQPASSSPKKEVSLCVQCLLPHAGDTIESCIHAQAEAMKRLIDLIGDPGICRGCGCRIYWVEHRNGKKVPYTSFGLNHFINCPEAARFKR